MVEQEILEFLLFPYDLRVIKNTIEFLEIYTKFLTFLAFWLQQLWHEGADLGISYGDVNTDVEVDVRGLYGC